MKKILLLLIVMLLFAGCSKEDQNPSNNSENDTTQENGNTSDKNGSQEDVKEAGFVFETNGVKVPMNADSAPVIEALGESLNYLEAPSCAFQGIDKFYYYSGYELSTYPLDGKDYISSVDLKDDSVTTVEGIYIGSTLEDIVEAYGEDYTEESGVYTYTLGDTQLAFVIENNVAAAITYLAVVEGLQ